MQCFEECSEEIWPTRNEDYQFEVDNQTDRAKEPLPKCKNCNKRARPNGKLCYQTPFLFFVFKV